MSQFINTNFQAGRRIATENATVDVRALRPNILFGDIQTKVGSYFPVRYLPTLFRYHKMYDTGQYLQVTATPEVHSFVMPIGTIVTSYSNLDISGSLPANQPTTGWQAVNTLVDDAANSDPINTFLGIDETGLINIGRQPDGTVISVDARHGYYGYSSSLRGLFTICNGSGILAYDKYTLYDTEQAFPDVNGQPITIGTTFDASALSAVWNGTTTYGPSAIEDVVAPALTAGDPLPRPFAAANGTSMRPSGIVIKDVRRDNRGQYYNYDNLRGQVGDSIMVWGKIRVPYVIDNAVISNDITAINNSTSVEATMIAAGSTVALGLLGQPGVTGLTAAYDAIVEYPSCIIDADGLHATQADATTTLYADTMGKFTNQIFTVGGPAITQYKVGTLLSLDNKFPRDMMEYVDTVYNSKTQGTDTMGIYAILYAFTEKVMTAYGALQVGPSYTATRKTVLEAIKAGLFGYAEIMVNLV